MGEVPGPGPEEHNESVDAENEMQLESKLEKAKTDFLEIAKTEGPTSETIVSALVVYHNLLQIAAESQEDRERWLCTEILNTYIAANNINPQYQEIVDSAREDLELVQ